MTADTSLFPALEPYRTDFFSVSSTHKLYFEECGNPDGVPVIVLHGGPGSGCNAGQRRFFDPGHYRIVLFDQRGSGRSRPAGCTEGNTTQHLVADIEQLRAHLGVTKWFVFGGSWGSTLALSYALSHKNRIRGLILRGIFLAQPEELQWFLRDVRHFFPDAWERFTAILSAEERMDILSAYSRLMNEGDHQVQILAARTWCHFESAIMALLPASAPSNSTDAAMVARLKVHLHYLVNDCFLRNTPLLEEVSQLRDIPTVIIHGRYDMVCPIKTAYALHQAWPEAEFTIIPGAGHAAVEPGVAAALVGATEKFKLLTLTHHAVQTRP